MTNCLATMAVKLTQWLPDVCFGHSILYFVEILALFYFDRNLEKSSLIENCMWVKLVWQMSCNTHLKFTD